ncbi:peptide-methionine (S)-S-oxide reductase MsrA [Achromobacter sp. Marseille-Q0513]|uniref:peptide-methionine (S)-S-oxide reductase MsrA n=1 Tax=Achromobacter sp. Marseille-Q0513 TaxID=2829161 RepID=UPI001B933E17|nr:peptide-methionine (S)-S-oxide reductase MsrA [Achromobacter sp. Marseille-Q0513]MBR8657193.1 peptide-methionine (S)-S-oxide reductase MsrA [Achromobacter sp. Marseille-Q0513]
MPASFLSRKLPGLLTAACALAATLPGIAAAAEAAVLIPPPAQDAPASAAQEKAVLAGGCFWGVQAVFQHVKGVSSAVSGYAGGQASTANYDTVSGGRSGHAEAVEITYDPAQVSYGQLLQIYFSVAHDPTQLNRQGPDTGTQYRSAVFPASDGQRQVAEAYIAQLNRAGVYGKPMATTIEPLKAFYRAEDYHQDYLVRHPYSMYIMVNDVPKVENLAKVFPARYQDKPALVYP